jgi:hypothetical protein
LKHPGLLGIISQVRVEGGASRQRNSLCRCHEVGKRTGSEKSKMTKGRENGAEDEEGGLCVTKQLHAMTETSDLI